MGIRANGNSGKRDFGEKIQANGNSGIWDVVTKELANSPRLILGERNNVW